MVETFQRIQPYLKKLAPVKWAFAGSLLCSLLYGISSGFGLPFMMKYVFPRVFGEEVTLTSWEMFLVVAYLPAVFGVRNLSAFFSEYWMNFCGLKILEDLRNELFGKLQRLPLSYYERHHRGDLLSRVMNDTNQLQLGLTQVTNSLVKDPLTFLGAITFLAWLAFQNSEIVFLLFNLMIIPACVFPIRYIGRKLYEKALSMQAEMGGVTELVNENIGAVREVRAFNLQESQVQKFSRTVRKLLSFQLKVVKYSIMLSPLIEFVASIGVAFAIFYASKAKIPLEIVLSLMGALYMSYTPIKKLGKMHNQIKRAVASLDRIEEILYQDETVKDRPDAHELGTVEGEIVFANVTFSYQAEDGAVLRDLNCVLQAGKSYALAGPSGAGKSTFANLVLRFYDVDAGHITIDGNDIRAVTKESLRRNISIVSQDPVLFNDTIFNNIQLSRPGATEADVYAASRQAFAHDFILSFEHGYQTVAGERGTRLSGGQKQRIALARAFLKNAPILILDEATSALDSESETKIQAALAQLTEGKTVVTIAHRMSTIRSADCIFVFEKGRIIAQGPHEELLQQSSLYNSLWSQQSLGLQG